MAKYLCHIKHCDFNQKGNALILGNKLAFPVSLNAYLHISWLSDVLRNTKKLRSYK